MSADLLLVPEDVAEIVSILDRPRAKEMTQEPDFPTLADLRRRFGTRMEEEEFLLRAVIAAEQVDSVLAARAGCSTYTADRSPLFMLLRAPAARPSARSLVVEVPGPRVTLHGAECCVM